MAERRTDERAGVWHPLPDRDADRDRDGPALAIAESWGDTIILDLLETLIEGARMAAHQSHRRVENGLIEWLDHTAANGLRIEDSSTDNQTGRSARR
jgi:hypothetical protein